MDPAVAVVLAAAVSAIAAAGAAVITNRVAGRANRTNAMLEWARQLQASEQAARREAAESRDRADRIKEEADGDVEELRTELNGLRAQLRDARAMAEKLTDTLASVQAEVWRPEPDIHSLRRLVGRRGLGLNGSGIAP